MAAVDMPEAVVVVSSLDWMVLSSSMSLGKMSVQGAGNGWHGGERYFWSSTTCRTTTSHWYDGLRAGSNDVLSHSSAICTSSLPASQKPHISATGRRPVDSPRAALGILVYSNWTFLMSEEWLLLELIFCFLCGVDSRPVRKMAARTVVRRQASIVGDSHVKQRSTAVGESRPKRTSHVHFPNVSAFCLSRLSATTESGDLEQRAIHAQKPSKRNVE
ncbi:hypothetical protein ARMGADRAFT_482250 [Armillaria gallica]|uniref:Uncharacterized protein n=1 Tax=Armillaria gallica TaxID=47427 RepID=A0A2H3EHX1_ARMGA|nr:hypothetical protein ARMGADRAFT_482250 [Armillaria gallica]